MEYTESDLPIDIKHGEFLTLADGSTIRWESNGEAKDVFFGDSFTADVELFPDNEYEHEAGGNRYKLRAKFEDALYVEKL